MPRPQTHDRWPIPESLRRETIAFARELRQRQTRSEQLLWEELRGRKVDGVKFRRQAPIGPFVVDFCAPAIRLIVEVDGCVHEQQREHDADRQRAIELLGFRFLRLPAEQVEQDVAGAIDEIRRVAREMMG